jgi:NADH-quinone oxidoreductase subunit G
MPKVTIDGRTVEVPAGTNLIEAGLKVGVQIPHYCYHPRLSVVGQCRMCVVKVDGIPKLQTACSTQVVKDGMVVHVEHPEVKAAQEGVMEFLLINHPLDCPICDQAGECGLQDYSFKHGQAFSRFDYEDKRVYSDKERIPLGPHVLLNMNRCIQCTRCVRFTEEISGTGELGFFERGARAEIGTFPGRPLDNPLSGNVVDICPVGALTSTEFRFSERVWYLDKKPSICTGCDAGCNITLEHRRGAIRRYKPRLNPEVNDHWLCDFGRTSFRRYAETPRLPNPRGRDAAGQPRSLGWGPAVDAIVTAIRAARGGTYAFLGSGNLTTEEAFALTILANWTGTSHRAVPNEEGPERFVPNPAGGVRGRETTPNRRGAELAGLVPDTGGWSAAEILGDGAGRCDLLFVADSAFGSQAWDGTAVARLRKARFLVVLGWADTPLAQVADVALPTATHAEREGTFVNSDARLQRFERAFPPPAGQGRPALEVISELIESLGATSPGSTAEAVFQRLAVSIPMLRGLSYKRIPATGLALTAATAGAGGAA